MKNCIQKNSGITLIALTITIIIMMILASISIYEGKGIIRRSKMQTLETNMLTIQAKSKSYAEEIEAKIWTESDKSSARDDEFSNRGFDNATSTVTTEQLNQISDEIKNSYVAYTVNKYALKNMGLGELKEGEYLIIFNENDYNLMDVIYINGAEYNENIYYSLSSLQEAIENK